MASRKLIERPRRNKGGQIKAAPVSAEAVPFLRFRAVQGWAGTQPVVGLVPEVVVDGVLSRETMQKVFGCLTLYEDAEGCTYLGVWRRRRVARFLALLHVCGFTLRIVGTPELPAGLRQRWRYG